MCILAGEFWQLTSEQPDTKAVLRMLLHMMIPHRSSHCQNQYHTGTLAPLWTLTEGCHAKPREAPIVSSDFQLRPAAELALPPRKVEGQLELLEPGWIQTILQQQVLVSGRIDPP